VGAALGALRKEAGVTQDELATRLSKPQSFVSSYERGQRRVDLLEFIAIVRALKGDPVKMGTALLGTLCAEGASRIEG